MFNVGDIVVCVVDDCDDIFICQKYEIEELFLDNYGILYLRLKNRNQYTYPHYNFELDIQGVRKKKLEKIYENQ